MAAWPGTLPPLMYQGFEEQAPNLVIRTQMDAGPAKVRRRYTAGPRPIGGALSLTKAQVEILDAFYLDDCDGGALSFTWTHPRTEAAETFRFLSTPKYSPHADNVWEARVQLEVLP